MPKNISSALKLGLVGITTFGLSIASFAFFNYSSEEMSRFGDYMGGVVGSTLSFASIVLFYIALKEQRADFKNNRISLRKQTKALTQQIKEFQLQRKEFELQREELQLTRDVFKEQSKTLKLQQFEATFFNSISLLNNVIQDIKFKHIPIYTVREDEIGRNSFSFFYHRLKELYEQFKSSNTGIRQEDMIKTTFHSFFIEHGQQLGHYFRTVYNIIKMIDSSDLDNPKYYTSLLRAQFSAYEHLLIFYNCLSDYGNKLFKPLIEKYALLDNLFSDELLEPEHIELFDETAYQ